MKAHARRLMGFIDLHSHILPGLDDGAADEQASQAMIQGLAALGFDTICATPHQKAGQFLPALEAIRDAHAEVSERARAQGLHIPLGAENMWDEVFFARATDGEIPSYDDGPAFLVEFRRDQLPPNLLDHLFRIKSRGKLPVIAHPERYQPLWKAPALVERLSALCAMVVDLGAVAGYHGRGEAKAARAMLRAGVIHAVASDMHGPGDVRSAAEGMAWIRKRLGEDELNRLLADNPQKILAGRHPGAR